MLQNAYFLAKIGADTAENEQHFAEFLPKNLNLPILFWGAGSKETALVGGDAAAAAARVQRPDLLPPASEVGGRGIFPSLLRGSALFLPDKYGCSRSSSLMRFTCLFFAGALILVRVMLRNGAFRGLQTGFQR